jgi:hypothetical protein
VAAMHAVEVADRQRHRSSGRACQVPLYTHAEVAGGETRVSRRDIRSEKPAILA